MKKILLTTWLIFLMCLQVLHAEEFQVVESFRLWSNTYETDTIRLSALSPGIINPHNCSDSDSYMVASNISQVARDRIFAVLMSASLSGRKVNLVLEGCERNRPAIQSVILLRDND